MTPEQALENAVVEYKELAGQIKGLEAAQKAVKQTISDIFVELEIDKAETAAPGVGALRLRLVATKGRDESMTLRGEDGKYAAGVLLDLDIWVLIPV